MNADTPNEKALEDFEVKAVHHGVDSLLPHHVQSWQRKQPEPLGYLRTALFNLFGEQWQRRLRIVAN